MFSTVLKGARWQVGKNCDSGLAIDNQSRCIILFSYRKRTSNRVGCADKHKTCLMPVHCVKEKNLTISGI